MGGDRAWLPVHPIGRPDTGQMVAERLAGVHQEVANLIGFDHDLNGKITVPDILRKPEVDKTINTESIVHRGRLPNIAPDHRLIVTHPEICLYTNDIRYAGPVNTADVSRGKPGVFSLRTIAAF